MRDDRGRYGDEALKRDVEGEPVAETNGVEVSVEVPAGFLQKPIKSHGIGGPKNTRIVYIHLLIVKAFKFASKFDGELESCFSIVLRMPGHAWISTEKTQSS